MSKDRDDEKKEPSGGPEERLHEFLDERFPGRKPPWEEDPSEGEAGSEPATDDESNAEDEEHPAPSEEPDDGADEA